MKAKFKENEIGSRKQYGLEQQRPTAREACKAGDVIIQQVVKMSINYSLPIHAFALCLADPPFRRQFIYSTHWIWLGYITNGASAKVR